MPTLYQTLSFAVDADGVALVTIDVAGQSTNRISANLLADLDRVIAELAQRQDIRGAVLASGKESGYLFGRDPQEYIAAFGQGLGAGALAEWIARSAGVFRALETCGKPVAAAVDGAAIGAGYELCLACHFTVLSEERGVVGMQGTAEGLLPAFGGTQRLPRLIGIEKALPLLLSGRHVRAEEALSLGLVDAVAPAADLMDVARRWVLSHPDAKRPWDVAGYRVPGGVGALAPHSNVTFGATLTKLRRDTQDNFPAPPALLSAVFEGSQLPFDAGLKIEAQYGAQVLSGPVARNLMRTLTVHLEAARQLVRRPAGVGHQPVRRLGIVGAGMMGAGIAQVAAAAGIDVVLIDADLESAQACKGRIAAAYAKEKSADAAQRLSRIVATADLALLGHCDLVIEAVFEDRRVKAELMARAAQVLRDQPANFVWASNTSTLPISSLAENWEDPKQIIGLHFFSPVSRMSLVEVILGKETSATTLARALDLVQQLRKTPIVVHDSPGFYTSRVFCAYIDEGMAMLAEGIAPALIENAARQAGFATGPLAVTDEVSLTLQRDVIDQAAADGLDHRFLRAHAKPVVDRMLSLGRQGRKSGGGFYDYPDAGGKCLWAGLQQQFPSNDRAHAVSDLKQRLLCMQALESARCVEEGVVTDAADADIGSILGLGFPSWTGGPLSYIDTVGVPAFVLACDRLADLHGERFRPSAKLRQSAADRTFFHASSALASHDAGHLAR